MEYTKIENKRMEEHYFRMEHRSGLTVMVYPKKGFHSTYAIIGTRFGSIYSRFLFNGKEIHVPDGTAHYLEHKLFESEDGDAFSKYARTGASANAYTSFNKTCYLFSCTSQFEESLKILLELVQTPYFTKETIAKEFGIISQEIKMYDDSPDWRVMMNMLQGMFHSHPINIDIAGTVESISQITPEVLYDCYNSYYNLHNMVLAVVGNVDPEAVKQIVDKHLRTDAPVETKLLIPDEPYEVVKPYVEQVMPVSVPMFELGFKEHCPAESASPKEIICTDILMNAFIGESSELYRRLMDSKLINSSFGAEYMEGLGYRSMILSGESRDPKAAADMILEAVRQLHKDGIAPSDFEAAKNVYYGKLIAGFDSKQAIANELIEGAFTGRELFDIIDIAAGISLQDIHDRLAHQFDADNTCLSVVRGE